MYQQFNYKSRIKGMRDINLATNIFYLISLILLLYKIFSDLPYNGNLNTSSEWVAPLIGIISLFCLFPCSIIQIVKGTSFTKYYNNMLNYHQNNEVLNEHKICAILTTISGSIALLISNPFLSAMIIAAVAVSNIIFIVFIVVILILFGMNFFCILKGFLHYLYWTKNKMDNILNEQYSGSNIPNQFPMNSPIYPINNFTNQKEIDLPRINNSSDKNQPQNNQ